MARKPGKRYPLIVYKHIVSRWWAAMIAIGLGMFALAYTEYIDPLAEFIPSRWQLFAAVGGLAIGVGIFFFIIRYIAYIQPHANHLKVVTPFLRFNISYKRLRRTATTEMRLLIPIKKLSGWVQDIFEPLANKTAIVLELSGYPLPPTVLRLFLSRFFFKANDKTPHLVILVDNWMGFTTEVDSMRTGTEPQTPEKRTRTSILSKLPQK